jgi:hypothetical protein
MATPEFIFKKTTDLTTQEKDQIRSLFLSVFAKEKSATHFDSEFLATPLGYSFHGLMVQAGTIVGCYSSVPYRYTFFGTECIFALSVDTMINDEWRGLDNLKKLANLVYAELQKAGVEFVFGFPNDNIHKIRKRFLGWKDLGTLDYFVLPIRPGAFLGSGRWLNLPALACARLLNLLVMLPWSASPPPPDNISLIDDELFQRHRYRFFEGTYLRADLGRGGSATYRLDSHEGARLAYILDLTTLSRDAVQRAARCIFARHHADIDAIAYVGKLRFRPINLPKVPKRYEPKTEYMSGRILAGNVVDDRVYDINNWKVNLSTFDVI